MATVEMTEREYVSGLLMEIARLEQENARFRSWIVAQIKAREELAVTAARGQQLINEAAKGVEEIMREERK